jgi:hypothetical protein
MEHGVMSKVLLGSEQAGVSLLAMRPSYLVVAASAEPTAFAECACSVILVVAVVLFYQWWQQQATYRQAEEARDDLHMTPEEKTPSPTITPLSSSGSRGDNPRNSRPYRRSSAPSATLTSSFSDLHRPAARTSSLSDLDCPCVNGTHSMTFSESCSSNGPPCESNWVAQSRLYTPKYYQVYGRREFVSDPTMAVSAVDDGPFRRQRGGSMSAPSAVSSGSRYAAQLVKRRKDVSNPVSPVSPTGIGRTRSVESVIKLDCS